MAGFCGIIGNATEDNRPGVSSSIDLLEQDEHWSTSGPDYYFEVAFRINEPLKGPRYHEDERFILMFHGDFVDYENIPWREITDSIRSGDFTYFRKLSGMFSFFAYDKIDGTARLISDRQGQDTVYYHAGKNQFIFSTDLATFCRVLDAELSEEWLYEYYFFNIAMSDRTPIRKVIRLRYAEILTFSDNGIRLEKYAEMYRQKEKLLSGRESLEYAYEVFSNRIPEYYKGSSNIACALSGGWDARTVLAFAPDLDSILAYTYGVPGAADQLIASNIAKKNNLNHELIDFDDSFVQHLPSFMLKSVFLSSGLNHVGRCSLYYTYSKLYREKNVSLLISGIHLDALFRGHAHIPAAISYGALDLFKGNQVEYDRYGFIRSAAFKDHIEDRYNALVDELGDPRSNVFYMLYVLYYDAQKFEGEIKIADQFCTIRLPTLDNEIVDLAFGIEESSLTYSQFGTHTRGDWPEMLLQSYLLTKARKEIAEIPVGYTSPEWVLKGKRAHQIKCYLNRLHNKIKYFPGLGAVPLENNKLWMNGVHSEFVEKLVLSESSLIGRYFNSKHLQETIRSPESHYTLKLITVELIIRLIKNGWSLKDLEADVLN